MGFDFVGTEFALMGALGVPATRVMGLARWRDVLEDDGRVWAAFEGDAENLAIAAPEFLNLFDRFE